MKMEKTVRCQRLNDSFGSVTEDPTPFKYLLPGETAIDYGRKQKIILESDAIEKSPMRQKVICPVFYACGGCDFLHIKYDEQLKLKEQWVQNLFIQSNIKTEILPVLSNPLPLHYRHKVVLSAKMEKTRLKLGLYKESSKDIVSYLDCHLHDPETNAVMNTVEEVMNKYRIGAYDIDLNQGILKHVLIRKSFKEHTMLLVLVTHGLLLPNYKLIVKDILEKHKAVTTIVQNIHHKKTHLVLLDEEKVLYGSGQITDHIGELRFRLSSKSFFQVNPIQMTSLYQAAIQMADIKPNDVVMDAYSGIGTISMLAARTAKQVIAVETNRTAHEDALHNKKMNDIRNLECVHADVSEYIATCSKKIDVLIMDPTRDGASETFLKALLKLMPKKIIYISCNPQTQARDIKLLQSKYVVKAIQPVDMFSQTVHVETVALLSIRERMPKSIDILQHEKCKKMSHQTTS